MRRILCYLFIALFCSLFADNLPPKATKTYPTIPIRTLVSSTPPQDCIWVRAQIVCRLDNDTFLIRDSSGEITLFLPVDSLLALTLNPECEIYIYGKVDLSLVNPQKNEFYAEKILLITQH